MIDEKNKEIVSKTIEKIIVITIGDHKYKIQVINKTGYIDNCYWLYESNDHGPILRYVYAGDAGFDFTDYVKQNKRFIRKR